MGILQDKAVAELTWAADREKRYIDDGAPVPEPIRRLKEFAALVQTAGERDAARLDRDTIDARARAEGYLQGRGISIQAIGDAASVLVQLVAGLKNTDPFGLKVSVPATSLRANPGTPNGPIDTPEIIVRRPTDEDRRTTPDSGVPVSATVENSDGSSTRVFAVDSPTGPLSSLVVQRTSANQGGIALSCPAAPVLIPLSDGLVLADKHGDHRVMISELKSPTGSTWISRTVTPDSKLGPVTGTTPEAWVADRWQVVNASNGKQVVIPGTGTETSTSPTVQAGRIGDWNPSDDTVLSTVQSVAKKLAEEKGQAVRNVTIENARSLLAAFKSAKADGVTSNPGASFYHWARRQLSSMPTPDPGPKAA